MAVLLRDEILYAGPSEIEKNSLDNLVLTVVSNGLKLAVSTAYVQLENLDGVENKMKVLEKCNDIVDDSKIGGCIIFGDLNARHQNWCVSKRNSLFGRRDNQNHGYK